MVVETEKNNLMSRDLLSAQEISFAKVLAGNEKKKRDQGVKKLSKWLTHRSAGDCEFSEEDFMTIWTGLYYSMWMSDKPLIQEELAENLSNLIHCFASNESAALLFIKCFYLTMSQSWTGLDQFRIDKFCMLARRFLRQSFEYCSIKDWSVSLVKKLVKVFSKTVLDDSSALGLKLHFIEVFLEELAKVGREELKTSVMTKILAPFMRLMATTKDARMRSQLDNFFRHLIRQTDVAIEYEEKFQAWRSAGFPGGDISVVVPDDSDEEDENAEGDLDKDEEAEELIESSEKVLDPRAGSVHVELPQIPVPTGPIIKLLKKYEGMPESTLKGRRMVKSLIAQLRTIKQGKCPLGLKKVPKAEKFGSKSYINKCAMKLVKESLNTKQQKRKKREKIMQLNAKLNNESDDESSIEETEVKTKVLKKNKQTNEDAASKKIEAEVKNAGDNNIDTKKTNVGSPKKENVGKVTSEEPNKIEKGKSKSLKKNNASSDGVIATEEDTKNASQISENVINDNTGELKKTKVTTPDKVSPKKGKAATPDKVSPKVEGGASNDILRALYLGQTRKRKNSNETENVVGSLKKNVSPEGKKPADNVVNSEEKKENSPGMIKNSPKKLEETPSNLQNGKENRSLTSPKKRKIEIEDVDLNSHISKKRRASTGNWVVDEVEPDQPVEPPKIITLEKKDPWAEPLQEGETEIFIPKKRVSSGTPVFWQNALAKANVTPAKTPTNNTPTTARLNDSVSGRRISFNLAMNRAQEKQEYLDEVQRSPQIPFDSTKKPRQSALKPGLVPSPINPFYRSRKLLL